MIKILTVVGARPQFIKAAVISRLIRDVYHEQITEVLVHTGQHYDQNMSDIFFRDMDIPKPTFHLEVNEKTHGAMTGKMLHKLEEIMLSEKFEMVLVYGDTNSTLAGALAASKLHIPLAHVEAGLRSFWKKMPEEQNRILTDHLSDLLFCSSDVSVKNLRSEGVVKDVYNVGDIMLDSFTFYTKSLQDKELYFNFFHEKKFSDIEERDFYLLTMHRAENTSEKSTLVNIFNNLSKLDSLIVFPIHPRTYKIIKYFEINVPDNFILLEPVGYLEMLYFLKRCKAVITDSGGLQKEAYYAKKRCYTLRNQTEWVETLNGNWNTLCNPSEAFFSIILQGKPLGEYNSYYGDGNTGDLILNQVLQYLKS
jgi:UDP-GlcNAc3NAcA epimerase